MYIARNKLSFIVVYATNTTENMQLTHFSMGIDYSTKKFDWNEIRIFADSSTFILASSPFILQHLNKYTLPIAFSYTGKQFIVK